MHEPDQLRQLAADLRRDADNADYGAEETRIVADLFDAAASDDFLEHGDIRLVRECIDRLAEQASIQ
jgi:hypothetical protein